jgi:hypothetical protein
MSGKGLFDGLNEEKVRLIEKYRLVPKTTNGKLFWVRKFGNRPDHYYFTHRALIRCDIIELVFSFYGLCVAKMTYFKKNIDVYSSCKFNYRTQELEQCALWDMEFLVQKETCIPIDLRNLAAIDDITVFREMCSWLESQLPATYQDQQMEAGWVSASEEIRFAKDVTDFTRELKKTGPLGVGEGLDESALKLKPEAVRKLAPLTELVERERLPVPFDNQVGYNNYFASEYR